MCIRFLVSIWTAQGELNLDGDENNILPQPRIIGRSGGNCNQQQQQKRQQEHHFESIHYSVGFDHRPPADNSTTTTRTQKKNWITLDYCMLEMFANKIQKSWMHTMCSLFTTTTSLPSYLPLYLYLFLCPLPPLFDSIPVGHCTTFRFFDFFSARVLFTCARVSACAQKSIGCMRALMRFTLATVY